MGRERSSNNHWVSGVLIVILVALIFFVPAYGWAIRSWLSPFTGISGGANAAASQGDDQTLAAENDALQAQIAQLQVVAAELPTSSPDEVRAMVYSRYPLNFKNELLVNVGTDQGIASGSAVMFQGMLLGQVKATFAGSSLVQTIFDNSLKMPVRIGTAGVDGLLQGGSDPTIGSIAAGSVVMPGDIVYSAAPGLPYAEPIAEIVATSTSPDNLFEQATLNFPYDINNVETVLVTK